MVFMATAASSKPVLRESRRAVKPGDIMALNPVSLCAHRAFVLGTAHCGRGKRFGSAAVCMMLALEQLLICMWFRAVDFAVSAQPTAFLQQLLKSV